MKINIVPTEDERNAIREFCERYRGEFQTPKVWRQHSQESIYVEGEEYIIGPNKWVGQFSADGYLDQTFPMEANTIAELLELMEDYFPPLDEESES
jgi:hypothetical protein